MKKNKFFRIFRVFSLKGILSALISLILTILILYSLPLFIIRNINHQFLGFILNLGINREITPPDISIAEAMLYMSVPGVSFSEKEEKTIPTEPVEEETILPIIFENTAQSITYETAAEKGYKSIDGIYINNQTTKNIDISALLNKELDLSYTNDPLILIVHTHTTESYTPSAQYNYTPTDTDRTLDLNYNMASVGEVIYNHLTQEGFNVIHDKTINDYPSYSTSYSNSLKLVRKYIETYPSIKIVIDVHRDAITSQNGSKLRPVTSFSPTSAQVMMVIGTNSSGLEHPDWENNLSFALKLQHQMNTLYPSLARPLNLRRERFNQHLAPYAFILEVGTNGNTLDEAKNGAELFSQTLASLLKN